MAENKTLNEGSLIGAVLLVTGCCIGAGMLGLPVLSAIAGFEPSVIMFFISWLFMVSTGLLLLEVNLWFTLEVSLISMAERTLGRCGKIIGWVGFLFLFYALMVAYISGIGALISDFYCELTGIKIAPWIGSVAASLLFGYMIYLGTKAVDWFNRLLLLGLAISYLFLIYLGNPHIKSENLTHRDWSAFFLVVPTMIISFGYHNMIPTLTTYLNRNTNYLKIAIIIGSLIPLTIYLLWERLILGLISVEGKGGFREALSQGDMVTKALKNAIGSSWVSDLASYFAFFAIVTSFLGVALSFVDFLADGLKIEKSTKGKVILCLLVILIPLVFALLYPNLFLLALNYAGSFGAVILFGLLPVAMVWSGRYIKKIEGAQLLPGGKAALLVIFLFALGVIGLQIYNDVIVRIFS
jgi:tyrosine-specific transport protein